MPHWRALACLGGICLWMAAGPALADDPVRVAQAKNAVVGVMGGDAGSTDTEIVSELSHVLDDGTRLRVLPLLGQGALQTIADLVFLKDVDVAIVHADALSLAQLNDTIPRIETVEYIAKLFQEEVHVLAQPSVTSLHDLTGKPMEVGPPDSGTELTSAALLGALHVAPDALHDSQAVALARLRLGQVAAVVVVGGQPVPSLLEIPAGTGLHFLSVPLTSPLVDTYLPSSLTHQHYPDLVAPDQTVDTVAVGAMLVTLATGPDTLRGKRVNRFVDALFAHFDAFRQPGFDPKWREVSLSAQISGLRRYAEAEKLLRAQAAGGRREARH